VTAKKVDAVDGETEALALPQSHPGGEDDQGLVAVGNCGRECPDLAHAERHHLSVGALRQRDADAGRCGDQPLAALKMVGPQKVLSS